MTGFPKFVALAHRKTASQSLPSPHVFPDVGLAQHTTVIIASSRASVRTSLLRAVSGLASMRRRTKAILVRSLEAVMIVLVLVSRRLLVEIQKEWDVAI